MRVPRIIYQMMRVLSAVLPCLSTAERRGLALWVYGAVLAHSACQSAVVVALLAGGLGSANTLRQRLREWLWDSADKRGPQRRAVRVERCFAPLLGWVLRHWRGRRELALAIDATTQGARLTALVISVLYRGSAIPVAWAILPGKQPGPWLEPILGLLQALAPALPRDERWSVLVLADRGLWSPRLWQAIRQQGWHPLLRVQKTITVAPDGGERCRAERLVRRGEAWVGRGRLRAQAPRLAVTLVAVWTEAQSEPWVLVSDLPPERIGIAWYGLRMSIELGFRVLKSLGWQWQKTRRSDPARVARYWLVLAVATLWTLAHGSRAEDATDPPALPVRRLISVFRRGIEGLSRCLLQGRLWRRLPLRPDPWPDPPENLTIIRYGVPP
jgi:hypothetical protein